MTGEPYPTDPGDDDGIRRQQIQQMLGVIEEAVGKEDYTFVQEVAGQQDYLRPVDLAEYMDVKRRKTEDPVEGRRWHDALSGYLQSLDGVNMSDQEAEYLTNIARDMQFEAVTSNDTLAEEPEELHNQESEQLDRNWDEDTFEVDLSQQDIDKVRASTVFQSAKAFATGTEPTALELLEKARKIIEEYASTPERRDAMLEELGFI